jgi:hypothetical protein
MQPLILPLVNHFAHLFLLITIKHTFIAVTEANDASSTLNPLALCLATLASLTQANNDAQECRAFLEMTIYGSFHGNFDYLTGLERKTFRQTFSLFVCC